MESHAAPNPSLPSASAASGQNHEAGSATRSSGPTELIDGARQEQPSPPTPLTVTAQQTVPALPIRNPSPHLPNQAGSIQSSSVSHPIPLQPHPSTNTSEAAPLDIEANAPLQPIDWPAFLTRYDADIAEITAAEKAADQEYALLCSVGFRPQASGVGASPLRGLSKDAGY